MNRPPAPPPTELPVDTLLEAVPEVEDQVSGDTHTTGSQPHSSREKATAELVPSDTESTTTNSAEINAPAPAPAPALKPEKKVMDKAFQIALKSLSAVYDEVEKAVGLETVSRAALELKLCEYAAKHPSVQQLHLQVQQTCTGEVSRDEYTAAVESWLHGLRAKAKAQQQPPPRTTTHCATCCTIRCTIHHCTSRCRCTIHYVRTKAGVSAMAKERGGHKMLTS